MSSPCNYNCSELGVHEQLSCGEHLKGGIDVVGLLDCNHTITDFENATQLNAAIAAGKLKLISAIKGEIPEATPVESDTLRGCGPETDLDSYDHVGKWEDGNVTADNIDFYNTLKKLKYKLIFYTCVDQKIWVYDSKFSFIPVLSVPGANKAKQKLIVTVKTTWEDLPALYDAPAGVFA